MKPTLLLLVLLLNASFGRAALLPDEENTISVAKEAAQSVVFVLNIALRQDVYQDEFAVPQGGGSGFVWDKEGHIVTNFHVVQGGDSFVVTLRDHTELKAKVIGVEPRKDIAVLKVVGPVDKLVPLPRGASKTLQVGQKTIAIGNPFGLDNTVTTGIVSALGRQVQGIAGVMIREMIQTDASINPGNSGGPLLDSAGKVIGMNTIIYSRSGSSAGIGFAVPIDFIKKIVPQLIATGRVVQPGIGVALLTEEQKMYLLGNVKGVVVREVAPGSPADKAGLRGLGRDRAGRIILGDIIVALDSQEIANYDDLYYLLDDYKVGAAPSFTVVRDGRARQVKIPLVNVF